MVRHGNAMVVLACANMEDTCKECDGSGVYENGRVRCRYAADARNVGDLVCVNMEDSEAYARNVMDLVCVNMEECAADAYRCKECG